MANFLQTLRLFRRDVRLFLIATAFLGFSFFGISTLLLNLYLLRLGYGPEFLGLVNGAGALGLAGVSLFAGMVGKRWGYRRTLATGLVLDMVGLGLLPFAEFVPAGWQVGWLLATNTLAWIGGATFVVNSSPFLMAATKPQERNHAFSMQSALMPLAGFAGNLIGGLMPGIFAGILGFSLNESAPYRFPL